jgi:hypothetical protein
MLSGRPGTGVRGIPGVVVDAKNGEAATGIYVGEAATGVNVEAANGEAATGVDT